MASSSYPEMFYEKVILKNFQNSQYCARAFL